ncbi:MAG: nucleotidyltransferase domain-containing protein [Methanomicrobium sp.]|nr:nucleotidyltransferase domain-containing protein [Methanomicrobium sp.]
MSGSYEHLSESALSERQKEIVRSVTDSLKELSYVAAVYLFGSYAKNTHTPYSDIDIGVILHEPASRWQYEKAGQFASDLIDVEIFNRMPVEIRNAIVSEGILLYCRDEEYLSEIIKETVREYSVGRPYVAEQKKVAGGHVIYVPDKKERLLSAIAKIKQYYTEYSAITATGIPKREDFMRYHSVSMIMFAIINMSFSIGEEVILLRKLQHPKSHRDIFKILHHAGIISEELRDEMTSLVFYRNHFAHQYSAIEEADLYSIADKMDSVLEYVDIMTKAGLK